ncbi:MAG: DUF5694 domain-containing protein [Myxococcales bacterium]|nr:DUF5694 domain-containing protein [Myxococcales bacterium]
MPNPLAAAVKVMIVGTFHMSNPGHDLHNVRVDDVLAAQRQAEIASIVSGLARFQPTQVAVEWPADLVAERYPKYLAGTLPPSRNEVVQLGFRLAKGAGLPRVHGIDVDGDFPYQRVDAWARAHGRSQLLDDAGREIEAMTRTQEQVLQSSGIAAVLRYLNDPERIRNGNAFYRTVLRLGAGTDQPGADLLTAWYRRNFLICANLIQLSKPGDRIAVFYGSGHSFLLRQCVTESPGFELVEPNDFLPANR